MTSQEFIHWLRGFTEGVHQYNITPKQWDLLKEKLAEVKDQPQFPFGTPNTAPLTPPFPPYSDPYNPYKVTCDEYPGVLKADKTKYGTDMHPSGEVSIPSVWTGTPAQGVTYTVTSGSSANLGTMYTYPNGTTVTYTVGATDDNWNIKNKDLLHD